MLVPDKQSRFLLELGGGIVCGYVRKGLRMHLFLQKTTF